MIKFDRNDFIVARLAINKRQMSRLEFDEGELACFDGKNEVASGYSVKRETVFTFVRKNTVIEVPFGWEGGIHVGGVTFKINMPLRFWQNLPFDTYCVRENGVDYVLAHYDTEHETCGVRDYIRCILKDLVEKNGDTIAPVAGREREFESVLERNGLAIVNAKEDN